MEGLKISKVEKLVVYFSLKQRLESLEDVISAIETGEIAKISLLDFCKQQRSIILELIKKFN